MKSCLSLWKKLAVGKPVAGILGVWNCAFMWSGPLEGGSLIRGFLQRIVLLLLGFVAGLSAHAQGTVVFYNHVTQANIDAPVFDVGGTTRLSGAGYLAQLYAGPSAGSLSPIDAPAPFLTGNAAGYWQPPASSSVIATVVPGTLAFIQVRAWATAGGATYEQAQAAGGKYGQSTVFSVTTGGDTKGGAEPPSFPAYLIGLQSFALVPEPSSVWLSLLGVSLIFYRRRKK